MPVVRILTVLWLICLVAGCQKPETDSGSSETRSDSAVSVTLALNWLPEAEHGGFYAALLNGTYQEAGFEVEILPGGPDSPVIQRVALNRVTFGVSNADRILMGRAQGAPVVALMAPLQHSPRCILVHAEAGIENWDQLQNVTLAMSDAPAFSHFLRKKLPLTDVKIVRNSGTIAEFLQDKRFAQQAYVFSEPIIARKQGASTKELLVSDLGFDPYSSVLITSEDWVKEHPQQVQAFVNASIAGWKSYLENPGPVHDHLQTINPEMPRSVLDKGVEALKPLCLDADGTFTGGMTQGRWDALELQLIELSLMEPGAAAHVQWSQPAN
ncbi:MAG: ABC transporter substrate-binding protein [Planctomycetaceae bacterium]|nr:ABC transporter substrate-binding protein [Planctomycetaceae bacterium]